MINISRESEINLINILIDQDIISGKDLANIKKVSSETKKSQLKRKRNNNNTGNANRSARRVNTIRPVIMKMTHLTNNQKAFYINQARTNLEKNLNDIKNNALARR